MISLNPWKNPRYPVTAKTSLPIETIPPLPQGGSLYLYDPRVWRFPQRSVRVVDIRKHKSLGDTIVRHSGSFFIVQPGVSREIRRRCALALAQTGPSKYFNYSSVGFALVSLIHMEYPLSPHEQSNLLQDSFNRARKAF